MTTKAEGLATLIRSRKHLILFGPPGSGKTLTLPGSVRAMPKGQACDDCGQPATRRVQGETDSFGAEWADLCDNCYEREQERRRQEKAGNCDWCGQHSGALISTRDVDEGMCGPVYRICGSCRDKQLQALDGVAVTRSQGSQRETAT